MKVKTAILLCVILGGVVFAGETPAEIKAKLLKMNDPANIKVVNEMRANWKLSEPEAFFKKLWGDKLGAKLTEEYLDWWKRYRAQEFANLDANIGRGCELKCAELGKDRPAYPGFESDLMKGIGKASPVVEFHAMGPKYSAGNNRYLVMENGEWKCIGGYGFLDLPITPMPSKTVASAGPVKVDRYKPIDFEKYRTYKKAKPEVIKEATIVKTTASEEEEDPLENQKPTIASFDKMVRTFSFATKKELRKRTRHITAKWRMPEDKELFKKTWGEDEGPKLYRSYLSCVGKYTDFGEGEWYDASVGLSECYGEEAKVIETEIGWWPYAFLTAIKWKEPVYLMKTMDYNAGSSPGFQCAAFIYYEGAFRFLGFGEYMGSKDQMPRAK